MQQTLDRVDLILTEAIKRLDQGRPLNDVFRYVDQAIPIPDCIQKMLLALRDRDIVKRKINEHAAERQTKTTGPTLTK